LKCPEDFSIKPAFSGSFVLCTQDDTVLGELKKSQPLRMTKRFLGGILDTMEPDDRSKLAALLKRAAEQSIAESDFWAAFNILAERIKEPVVEAALESATHYWGNFHAKSILFLIPVKPSGEQLQQGRNELNLIAEALEAGWELPMLEEKLKDI
jgi:hypothetical protein